MKIYIAGKITSLNFDEVVRDFARAEQELLRCGQSPVNPLREVDQAPGRRYEDYLRDALKVLLTCEAIYLLPNWKESEGAKLEKAIAEGLKMMIVTHGFEGRRGTIQPDTEIAVCGTPAPIELSPGWKGCVRPKGHSGHCTAVPPSFTRRAVKPETWIECSTAGCPAKFIQTDPDAEVDLCPPCEAAVMRVAA